MKINKKPYDRKIFFKKDEIEFKNGITVLVGCNGYGKSTFLIEVREALKENKIPFLSYDNLFDGGQNSTSWQGFIGNLDFLAQSIQSSEGQNIIMNMGLFAKKIGEFVVANKSNKELYVLIDAVDSGLSIDNINFLKKEIFNYIIDDCKNNGINIRFIISANSYEMANEENCFDVYKCEYINFNNYEEYKKFILKTSKIVEKRYKK